MPELSFRVQSGCMRPIERSEAQRAWARRLRLEETGAVKQLQESAARRRAQARSRLEGGIAVLVQPLCAHCQLPQVILGLCARRVEIGCPQCGRGEHWDVQDLSSAVCPDGSVESQ